MQTITRDLIRKTDHQAQELNEEQKLALRLFCSGLQEEDILKSLNISHSTYYRLLKEIRKVYGVRKNRDLLKIYLLLN
jgi:DNA-binding CsgD family transcriptional regulator